MCHQGLPFPLDRVAGLGPSVTQYFDHSIMVSVTDANGAHYGNYLLSPTPQRRLVGRFLILLTCASFCCPLVVVWLLVDTLVNKLTHGVGTDSGRWLCSADENRLVDFNWIRPRESQVSVSYSLPYRCRTSPNHSPDLMGTPQTRQDKTRPPTHFRHNSMADYMELCE